MKTIIANLEERLQIRVLTPEYAILLHLFERSPESSEQLLEVCGVSRSQFHTAMRSLEKRGLIEKAGHVDDRRLKFYSLSIGAREQLSEMFSATPEWIAGQLSGEPLMGVMPRFTRELRRRMGVIHTTCAYEILLFLYDTPGQTALGLFSYSNFSSTTFYTTLSRLKSIGQVVAQPDEKDLRSLRYRLESSIAEFMDEQHVLILQWLQPKLED